MEIQGKIIQKLPLRSGMSQRGTQWSVQEYVLETYDQYPRKVFFTVFGDRIQTVTAEVGADVTVSFDIESRSFVGRDGVERWSTDVRAWRIAPYDPSMQAPAAPQYAQPAPQPAAPQFAQPAPAVGQFQAEAAAAPSATEDLPF